MNSMFLSKNKVEGLYLIIVIKIRFAIYLLKYFLLMLTNSDNHPV